MNFQGISPSGAARSTKPFLPPLYPHIPRGAEERTQSSLEERVHVLTLPRFSRNEANSPSAHLASPLSPTPSSRPRNEEKPLYYRGYPSAARATRMIRCPGMLILPPLQHPPIPLSSPTHLGPSSQPALLTPSDPNLDLLSTQGATRRPAPPAAHTPTNTPIPMHDSHIPGLVRPTPFRPPYSQDIAHLCAQGIVQQPTTPTHAHASLNSCPSLSPLPLQPKRFIHPPSSQESTIPNTSFIAWT